jgi:hypothetical protein
MLSPMLVVDGNEKFSIDSGDHRYLILAAGDHSLGLNPTDQYTTGAALALAVEANSRYYLRINTSLEFVPDGMNTRRFWLQQVEGPQALKEIAATDYAGPLQQPIAEQPDDSAASEGFTIDRARYPFSTRD